MCLSTVISLTVGLVLYMTAIIRALYMRNNSNKPSLIEAAVRGSFSFLVALYKFSYWLTSVGALRIYRSLF